MSATSDTRQFLESAIRRALSGEDVADGAIEEYVERWPNQTQLEKSALMQLRNWTLDRSLRSQFNQHARYSEHRLAGLLHSLEEQEQA